MLNFLFPKVCGICGEKINERYTCTKCLNILEYYQGRHLSFESCETYYDELICLYPYKGILKSKMLQLKFYRHTYLAKTFGDIVAYTITKRKIKADYIIPVPISQKRLRERGFNQTELMAKTISQLTNINMKSKILNKTKDNLKQSMVELNQRSKNVSQVYEIKKNNEIKGRTVILIDDIYTTGATMNECAKILKKNGVAKVIAIAVLYSIK